MVLCFAFGCNHQTLKSTCSFFTFPKPGSKENRLWQGLCRRKDRSAGKDSRLCSCHFVDGKKVNGPTIFDYGKKESNRHFQYSSPEKRTRKRKLITETDTTTTTTTTTVTEPTDESTSPMTKPENSLAIENDPLQHHQVVEFQQQLKTARSILTFSTSD